MNVNRQLPLLDLHTSLSTTYLLSIGGLEDVPQSKSLIQWRTLIN